MHQKKPVRTDAYVSTVPTNIRKPAQLTLPLGSAIDPSTLLRTSLSEVPTAELRKGQIWRIGNLKMIDETGAYFAFGRMRKSAIERFDIERAILLQEMTPTAPYTHVLLDVGLQVAAIAAESKLAAAPASIAKRLAQVLSRSKVAQSNMAEIEDSEIRDPESFIGYLREAHAIRSFTFHFKPPNPFDVENEIHRPLDAISGKRAEKRARRRSEDVG